MRNVDDQQSRPATARLHAGAERVEAGNREGGDVGRVSRRHRTTQIKPATRNALMDQLALAADTIIDQRARLHAAQRIVMRQTADEINWALFYESESKPARWWHRLAWWRK